MQRISTTGGSDGTASVSVRGGHAILQQLVEYRSYYGECKRIGCWYIQCNSNGCQRLY
ncbi:MAG: hypothetical protein IPO14_04530 [Saprospiraceae bacterium]|nr:hypothetical protein [Saprospiraceae bacterium]